MSTAENSKSSDYPKVSPISNGKDNLQRLCTVYFYAPTINEEVNKALIAELGRVKTSGFRKGSRVVPPAYRKANERQMLYHVFTRLVGPALSKKLENENLEIFPALEISNFKLEGYEYVVECGFDVRPDIPEPEIKSLTLRKPVPDVSEKEVATIVNRILRQHAKYTPVERAAQIGDRVYFTEANSKAERHFVLGDPSPFAGLEKFIVGKKANEEVVVEDKSINNASNSMVFKITKVEDGEIPELTLDFARRLYPEVGSVDAFNDQVKEEINNQAKRMATNIMIKRALFSLDQHTKDFDLPNSIINRSYQNQVMKIEDRAKSVKATKEQLGFKEEDLRNGIKKEIRQSLIINQYVEINNLKVAEKEYEQYAQELAIQSQDANKYFANLEKSEQARDELREYALRNKICDNLYEKVNVEEVKMSLDELERIIQNGDPETRTLPAAV